jgi:hypothetical protein
LKQSVRRNAKRFPDDFMRQLTTDETSNLMFKNGTSSWGGRRKERKRIGFIIQGKNVENTD